MCNITVIYEGRHGQVITQYFRNAIPIGHFCNSTLPMLHYYILNTHTILCVLRKRQDEVRGEEG